MSGTTKIIPGQVHVGRNEGGNIVQWTSKRPYHVHYSSQEKGHSLIYHARFTSNMQKIMVIPSLLKGECLFAAQRLIFNFIHFGFNKLLGHSCQLAQLNKWSPVHFYGASTHYKNKLYQEITSCNFFVQLIFQPVRLPAWAKFLNFQICCFHSFLELENFCILT